MLSGDITIRVRYAETDRMGLLHHANYLVYFEQGRTELLRSMGYSYRDVEDQGARALDVRDVTDVGPYAVNDRVARQRHCMHLDAVREQSLGEVAAVLAADTGDQRGGHAAQCVRSDLSTRPRCRARHRGCGRSSRTAAPIASI